MCGEQADMINAANSQMMIVMAVRNAFGDVMCSVNIGEE